MVELYVARHSRIGCRVGRDLLCREEAVPWECCWGKSWKAGGVQYLVEGGVTGQDKGQV